MANGLLLRLRERELSASPAERNVIAYVSAHPHEVVGLSVRGLADVTFSSPSSILRFCKRLGFAGYKEFQRELIAERTTAGLASARARGRNGGRPYKMTPIKLRLAMASMGRPETKVSPL